MIRIPSETHRLQSLIVHTPGPEVSNVNPEIKNALLFDDIIFEQDARQEHLDMLEVFQVAMGPEGKIYEIIDLIKEVLENNEAKASFIEGLIKALPEHNLYPIEKTLNELSANELTKLAIEGHIDSLPHIHLYPSPNLLFTRDLAAVVGDSIVVSKAATKARIRESLLMECLIRFHPLFKDISSKAIHVAGNNSIEGGDILVASEKVALIGMSERTSFSALHIVAEKLLNQGLEHVIAVDIPKQRASMHLDTIFTFTAPDECLVFPPSITELKHNVVALRKENGHIVSDIMPNLQTALEQLLGHKMTFINCGGDDRTNQFREQWTDGANSFALAPGIIVGYERNIHTFENLKRYGYEVMSQFEFIEEFGGTNTLPDFKDRKIAIHFMGHELCRGRGGARCMTLPIYRY